MVQVSDPRTGALLDPRQTPPTGAPTTDTGGGSDLGSQWNDWIGRPSNRAALMQFGIAMLQPVGIGQSQIGNMANAVGEAGEAAQRVSTEEMGRQREASQEELRTQQANLAGERAATQGTLAQARQTAAEAAETRARSAGEMGDLRRQNFELSNLTKTFQMQDMARKRYKDEVVDNVMIPQAKKPSYDEFLRQNPDLDWRVLQRSGAAVPGGAALQEGLGTPPAPTQPALPSYRSVLQNNPKAQATLEAAQKLVRDNPNDPRLKGFLEAAKHQYSDYPQLRRDLGLPPERGQ